MLHGGGKSDEAIVAVKPANAAEQSAAELVEPRAEAKGNAVRQSTYRTQRRVDVSPAPERIRHRGCGVSFGPEVEGLTPDFASLHPGYLLGIHSFTNYVKVAFFRGASLRPVPPAASQEQGDQLPRHP